MEGVGSGVCELGAEGFEAAAITEGEFAAKASTLDSLQGLARDAVETMGEGSGAVYGTKTHTLWEKLAQAKHPDLTAEVSYLGQQEVPFGTRGSIRLDLVEGDPMAPTAIYDLKTGSAVLTKARIQQIRDNLPEAFRNVPIYEVKP